MVLKTAMAVQFGWIPEHISHITNALVDILYRRWRHLLHWSMERLTPEQHLYYAYKILAKGAPTNGRIWGFVDGTVWRVCRPSVYQRALFNGWKRLHAIK